MAIHTANSYVSTHQRFLLAGIRVGLEATEPGSSSSARSQSKEKMSDSKSSSASRREEMEEEELDSFLLLRCLMIVVQLLQICQIGPLMISLV